MRRRSFAETLEALRHLLGEDPNAFERFFEPQLRRQYHDALEALQIEMQNPQRERKAVWSLLTALETSGRPAPQHILALVELERITRETGGTAYCDVEATVFKEMARLSHPELIPFLLEAFQYRRPYDKFAERRREHSADIAAVISARTADPHAIAALGEMLADPKPRIRGITLDVIYEAYKREGCEMPPDLLEHFWRLGKEDPDRRVRQTALALLQQMGQISYAEALRYLERGG